MAIWPVLLGLRSPDLFDEWFWANNVGRFTGYTTQRLGANASHGFWLATLPWFLFPVWVFALAALWRERRNFWDLPALQAGIALAAGTAILLGISASARSVYALPLLPPLAVAAVAGMRPPFGVLDRLLTVLAIALAIVALAAVWAIWLVLVVDGRVPDFVPAARWLPPVFDMQVRVALVAGAAALTAGFVFLVAFHRRVVHGALALWVGAIALAWGLAHTLWLPWLDHGRSYRGLYGEIKAQLPRDTRCILMQGVPESERALIEYYIGIPPRHRHDREQDCAALLWKGIVQDNPIHIWPGPQWRFAWRGQRPGEKLEGFDLFLRKNDGG
jgi:4-amino-4-deoxy-L-arabinose transferase-like glycosyltransferase